MRERVLVRALEFFLAYEGAKKLKTFGDDYWKVAAKIVAWLLAEKRYPGEVRFQGGNGFGVRVEVVALDTTGRKIQWTWGPQPKRPNADFCRQCAQNRGSSHEPWCTWGPGEVRAVNVGPQGWGLPEGPEGPRVAEPPAGAVGANGPAGPAKSHLEYGKPGDPALSAEAILGKAPEPPKWSCPICHAPVPYSTPRGHEPGCVAPKMFPEPHNGPRETDPWLKSFEKSEGPELKGYHHVEPHPSETDFVAWARRERAQRLAYAQDMGRCGAIPPQGVGRGFEVCDRERNHPGLHDWIDRAHPSGNIWWGGDGQCGERMPGIARCCTRAKGHDGEHGHDYTEGWKGPTP